GGAGVVPRVGGRPGGGLRCGAGAVARGAGCVDGTGAGAVAGGGVGGAAAGGSAVVGRESAGGGVLPQPARGSRGRGVRSVGAGRGFRSGPGAGRGLVIGAGVFLMGVGRGRWLRGSDGPRRGRRACSANASPLSPLRRPTGHGASG